MSAVSRFAPPLVLMLVIFVFSAQPSLNSGLGTWDTVLRKCAHMAEFGLLWWLWWRAFEFRRAWLAVGIALAYAATDEFHQTFVTGRSGSPWDWAIDAAGIAVAGLVVLLRRRRRAAVG
jgi:VanZ family protein